MRSSAATQLRVLCVFKACRLSSLLTKLIPMLWCWSCAISAEISSSEGEENRAHVGVFWRNIPRVQYRGSDGSPLQRRGRRARRPSARRAAAGSCCPSAGSPPTGGRSSPAPCGFLGRTSRAALLSCTCRRCTSRRAVAVVGAQAGVLTLMAKPCCTTFGEVTQHLEYTVAPPYPFQASLEPLVTEVVSAMSAPIRDTVQELAAEMRKNVCIAGSTCLVINEQILVWLGRQNVPASTHATQHSSNSALEQLSTRASALRMNGVSTACSLTMTEQRARLTSRLCSSGSCDTRAAELQFAGLVDTSALALVRQWLAIGAGSAAQFADFWLFLLLKAPRSKSRSGGHKHALIAVVHQNGGVVLLGESLYGCALQKVISSLVLGDAPVDPAVQFACGTNIGTGVTSPSGHVLLQTPVRICSAARCIWRLL